MLGALDKLNYVKDEGLSSKLHTQERETVFDNVGVGSWIMFPKRAGLPRSRPNGGTGPNTRGVGTYAYVVSHDHSSGIKGSR